MKKYFSFCLMVCACVFSEPMRAASPYDFQAINQATLDLSSYANLLAGELFTLAEQETWQIQEVSIQSATAYDSVIVSWIPIGQDANTWTQQIYSELNIQHAPSLASQSFFQERAPLPRRLPRSRQGPFAKTVHGMTEDRLKEAGWVEDSDTQEALQFTLGLEALLPQPFTLGTLADLIWVKAERFIPSVGPTESLLLRYLERYLTPIEVIRQKDGVNTYWQDRFDQLDL